MSRYTIAQAIRTARLARNMTQQQLADCLDITQQAIVRYEQGLVNIPSERLEQMATIFDMTPGEFYVTAPCHDAPPDEVTHASH